MRESSEGESANADGCPSAAFDPICDANPNLLATSVLVDELLRNGVRDVCISPGSRSAPLTLAFARRSEMRKHVHVDERCAAFFALGLARAAGRPVALVCTSGSAAANYHPAIMEAFETGVPLLVLGADRPRRLVDSGANQTTVQDTLFGPHVLRSETFDLPRAESAWLRWLRGRVCRLVELATGPRSGPVHVNLPFEEPLSAAVVPGSVPSSLRSDDPDAVLGRADGSPFSPSMTGVLCPVEPLLESLDRVFRRGPGMLVVGPMDASPSLAARLVSLADRIRVPVLADPLSGLRGLPGVVGAADAILRGPAAESLRPSWVLSFGRVPVSKSLFRFLGTLPGDAVFHVDQSGRRDDPEHGGPTFLRCEPGALVDALLQRPKLPLSAGSEGLRARWQAAEKAAVASLDVSIQRGGFLEGQVVRTLLGAMPAGAILWAASSMPVRELDAFFLAGGASVRVLASRGVSGIDGLVSATFGAEAAEAGATFGLLGDLATLHDVGGLAAVRRLGAGATLVVINNGGGGIFEHLPVAGTDVPVETYFVAAHEQAFGGIAAAFGLGYAQPTSAKELEGALALAQAEDRAWLIEVPIDRATSLAWHRATWATAARAAADAVG